MSDDSSESQDWDTWRTEHARDADSESTPLSEAASVAGHSLNAKIMGRTAISYLQEQTDYPVSEFPPEDIITIFGKAILQRVDDDSASSRVDIHQKMIEQGDSEPGELVAAEVEQRQREELLRNLGVDTLYEIAESIGV